jgi:hypothetical protein
MKKDTTGHRSATSQPHRGPRLALRRETVRMLTRNELLLAVSGLTPITEIPTESEACPVTCR